MRECRSEQRRLGRDVCSRVQKRIPEGGVVPRRDLALDLTTGGGRRELVELVEQPRDRVGPVRVELDRLVGARPQEQEAELLGGDHLGDGVGRGALTLRGGHLLATDVEELVRDVERRLALEHLAGDGVAPVARPAGRRQILAAGLDGHAEQRPLGRPFEVPRQLGRPAERAQPAGRPAALRPRHQIRPTLEEDALAVPLGHDRRADLAARGADHRERVPDLGMLDVGHAPVDLTDQRSAIEREPDVWVHRARRVDVAHPVIAVGLDPETGEHVDEDPREMAGVAGVAITGRVGDVGERPAHLAIDGVGRQQRLGVHRVHVIDAIQQRRLQAVGAQSPGDDVEDDRPAQAADVDRPGRRLRVVDDLRAADPGRELVRPVHADLPRL